MRRVRRPSRDGITRFTGDVQDLDGKVMKPGGLEIAQYEGLILLWTYQPGDVLALHMTYHEHSPGEPLISIPLLEDEIQLLKGHVEKGGWGYYELHVEPDDERAGVNVSFKDARSEPVSVLWILDKHRREELSRVVGRYLNE
jgi:hypothetical protein